MDISPNYQTWQVNIFFVLPSCSHLLDFNMQLFSLYVLVIERDTAIS